MHGLPHHVDQDLTLKTALDHLFALSKSERSITANVGCLTITGPLRFETSLDSAPNDPASAGQPIHIFYLGNGSLVIREVEFQGAHLWTADGDDYFNLTLKLVAPLSLTHSH